VAEKEYRGHRNGYAPRTIGLGLIRK
jgi:hypothetical protein